ncbi:MAG: flagellar M-ring protein FliF [Opitutales bacterium]|nr:flagellar M-ring protein FliF [Opitutales bacterium]
MKTIFTDFSTFWNSLEANQKVSFFLATTMLVIGVAAVAIWAQRPDMRLLYGGLDEKQAASIIQHLESESIRYELRHGGSAIFVPQREVYKARMDIVSTGTVGHDAVGFEIFDQSSFGASDFIQRTNFIRAIQGELSRTISQLSGVRSARVMVVMPENRLLVSQNSSKTTASVFVEVAGGGLDHSAVRSIQALVANSVEGLERSKVSVVDNHGNVLSTDESDDSMAAASSSILKYRKSVESYFSNKVETMLERVLGPENVTVRVHAEIDSEEFSRIEEVFGDGDGALLSSVTEEQSSSSTKPSTGGPVGAGDATAESAGTGGTSDEERRMRDQQFAVDRMVTNTSRRAGSISRLTASVFIAAKTETAEGETEPQIVPRSQEEIDNLRQIVAKSLGIDLDDSETGQIEVQEMPFAIGSQTLPPFPGERPEGFDLSTLMEYSSEIIGSVVALILFITFLIIYRKLKDQPSPFDQMEQAAASFRPGGHGSSDITPDLLNNLISQRPENTAASIKNWLRQKDES